MRTAIFTAKDTTLTIETKEDLYLEQKDLPDKHIKLKPGKNDVPVKAGVFKVLSTKAVCVTNAARDFQVSIAGDDKDGGPIDPILNPGGFLIDARGTGAPE